MKIKKESNNFSAKEIAVALNNAVQASLNPQSKQFSALRRQKLREYAIALLEPLMEHLKEQTYEEDGKIYPAPLLPEELTSILVSAALFVHLKETLRTDKIPMGGVTNELFGEK